MGLFVFYAGPAAAGTKLAVYSAGLNSDPNSSLWHLAVKVCNKDHADSGTILYKLRLYQGDVTPAAQYINIGGVTKQPLHPGNCYNSTDLKVRVNTKNVPPGEYKVVLFLGDYNGSTYSGHLTTFDHTFIQSSNPLLLTLDFNESNGPYTAGMAKSDCGAGWNNGLDLGLAHIVSAPLAYRDQSLQVRYLSGVVGPTGGVQFRCPLPSHQEMIAEYEVKFNPDFDFVKGGKLPGLCGGKCNTGGVQSTGDGWSSRYMWRPGGKAVLYLYYMDQPTKYGQDFPLNGTFAPGQWYKLAERIKMNTPGKPDGIVQVWVNDQQVLDLENIRFRAVSSVGVDAFYFSTFFGGNTPDWAPPKDEVSYFSNFKVYAP